MQVFPLNTIERVYNILCLLLGLVFFSFLISTLSAKLIQLKNTKIDVMLKLQRLQRFLSHHTEIDTDLAVRVQMQASNRLQTTSRTDVRDVPCLDILSLSLHSELKMALTGRYLDCQPLFYT